MRTLEESLLALKFPYLVQPHQTYYPIILANPIAMLLMLCRDRVTGERAEAAKGGEPQVAKPAQAEEGQHVELRSAKQHRAREQMGERAERLRGAPSGGEEPSKNVLRSVNGAGWGLRRRRGPL